MYKWLIASISLSLFLVSCDNNPTNNTPCESCITDSRDGKQYRTAQIGNLIWMAENLDYRSGNDMCYAYNSHNCARYGRLYTWASAMDLPESFNTTWSNIGYNNPRVHHRGICPEGWRIPNVSDLDSLLAAIGDSATAGTRLKATWGWNNGGHGTDIFGFAALPGGGYNYDNEDFWGVGNNAFWWFASNDGTFARILGVSHATERIGIDWVRKRYGFSVRCVRDISDY